MTTSKLTTALLLTLAAATAPPASAAASEPRVLLRLSERIDPRAVRVALTDRAALVSRPGRTLRVLRVPLDAGGRRSVVFRLRAPKRAGIVGALLTSGRWAALGAWTLTAACDEGDDCDSCAEQKYQAYVGPAAGPWRPLGPPRCSGFQPLADQFIGHQLDGERLFTLELDSGRERTRYVVRERGRRPRVLRLLDNRGPAAFADDLVAYRESDPDAPRRYGRVVLANWRTGQRLRVERVPGDVERMALRPDGRVLIDSETSDLFELWPGAALRRVADDSRHAAFAGERIVYLDGRRQLTVVEPDGRRRRLTPDRSAVTQFVADDERVLWTAGRRVLVADLGP